jgi:NADH dehydrogenase [ubiquinone] 1 alpha subcomplex assembly factor 7
MTSFQTIQSFPPLANTIENVYLVEASPLLREKQHQLLCGENALDHTDYGFSSVSKYARNLRIHWFSELSDLPPVKEKESPFVIAHEFFDALPIHVFQSITAPLVSTKSSGSASTSKQWRELLVSIAPPTLSLPISASPKNLADFALTQATHPTPHSLLLPTLLPPRYSSLLSLPAGATIEISPESISVTGILSKRIGDTGSGGAIIIDYGPQSSPSSSESPVPANTLRGIHAHELVSPFWGAGTVDLSASVDFGALAASALAASPDVELHGHVPQAYFLKRLGGAERCKMLAKRTTELSGVERGEGVKKGWERLVDEGIRGMGRLYQVLAIVPEGRAKKGGVVGFGGDVVV